MPTQEFSEFWPTQTAGSLSPDPINLPEPGISDAPSDGTPYVRQDAGWVAESVTDLSNYVRNTGETDAVDLTGSAGVTVPDATVDGQALAYLQAGARLQSLEVTNGSLAVVRTTTADLTLTQSNVIADQREFRIANSSGKTFLQARTDAGAPVTGAGTGSITIIHSSGVVDMSAAPSVLIPDPTSTASESVGQAAKVVAFDSVTGRYAVQGPNGVLEQGDTGWRDVSGLLVNGWTAGETMLRRVGDQITVTLTNATGGAATTALIVPTGFRPFRNIAGSAMLTSSVMGGAAVVNVQTTGTFIANNTIVGGQVTAVFTTAEPWPSSLPGTPAV